ncbi:facilitated trehalose transporter Tret1-2 homolog [Macrosteles quadrilineatus]|uniref:facilitated trehalose transporter Tret1-2 homolog n=1 Tax=Macrosteles quadrilineatus TaxID=74068 RepID=UPI0023E21189|nr:facilitated trehalose transporter Tret1-2 homolog [Macrosteles quadrilineatus]
MPSGREKRSSAAENFVKEKKEQEVKDLKEKGEVQHVSTFRQALPQVLASTAKNLILLDLGMTVAFPTIVIPVLLNAKTGLSFTTSQASWFGSIGFICQPLGSVLSGIVLEPLGRKYSMLLVNVPHIIGWYLFYSASSLFTMFTAIIIMGLGVGFMEAPIITYVGEISEPRFRGMLTSYAGIFVSLGFVVIYAMGNFTDWHHVAAISCTIPVITIIAISQVPETPLWLLSRGRLEEAEKALCWLRGWVEPRNIRAELLEMIRYSEASQLRKSGTLEKAAYTNDVSIDDEGKTVTLTSNGVALKNEKSGKSEFVTVDLTQPDSKSNNNAENCVKFASVGEHETDWKVRMKDLVRPEMLRPLGLVIGFFFFLNASGIAAMRPYFVKVFEKLKFPITPLHATVLFSVIQFTANILCMVSVRWTGKRPMALISLTACAIATTTTALYTFFTDPADRSGWLPFIMLLILQFFTGYGVAPVPWMLVSEVFPFRGRSLASGVAAAASYILGFVATKTFLSLEASLTLGGVFLTYGLLTFLGAAFLYYSMVETEGRSLEQIEQDYKKKINS